VIDLAALAERVWYGDARGARLARGALAPLGWAFGAVARGRAVMYDRGLLAAHSLAIPSVSVGNLSVGGTGKTPVAAWVVERLAAAGARAAVVLRGYGADETLVHAALNPGVLVVADADRVRGVARAAALGATVAVLDDAFQHRRARRDVDIVLVSADRWAARAPALLPAGPLREPLAALRRATVAVVTCRAADAARVAVVRAALAAAAPGVPQAVVRLAAEELRRWGSDERRAPASLAGEAVLAASAIGDPASFEAQLAQHGARVRARRFRDHHAFTAAEGAALAAQGAAAGGAVVVCTLKDAVKLGPLWPRGAQALWYLTQRVIVESGADELERAVGAALRSGRT
jgi:tetraacyldisaccharide 4'-kinase